MAYAFRAAQAEESDAIAQAFPDPEPLMALDDEWDRQKWW